MPASLSLIKADFRHWLQPSHLVWGAALLAIMALLLAWGFLEFAQRKEEADRNAQVGQYARLLAQVSNADMAMIETTVTSLGDAIEDMADHVEADRLGDLLVTSIRGRPQLRSVSVLDAAGRVLASSSLANRGYMLDQRVFDTALMRHSSLTIDRVMAGRDLADLQLRAPEAPAINLLPMRRRLISAKGQTLILVALVNVDYFSAQFELVIKNPQIRMALLDYKGELLVATSNVRKGVGSSLAHLPLYRSFLPKKEQGDYIDLGMDDQRSMSAFRALRHWPMILLVEHSYEDAMQELSTLRQWIVITLLTTWCLIVTLAFIAHRKIKRHDLLKIQLNVADQAMRASEARGNAVLESSIDGVISFDGEGRVEAFNPAAERMFGCKKEDCVDKAMDAFVVLENLQKIHHDATVFRRGYGRIETMGIHANGNFFPVELSIVSMEVNGRLHLTANVRDITDQKRAAQEMADLLCKYHQVAIELDLQKKALDQHAIVSIEDVNGFIVYANDKLIEISGYPREELLGRQLAEFCADPGLKVYDDLRVSLKQGTIWHGELEHRRKGGGSYWVTSTSLPIPDEEGRIHQCITVQTDVTTLRKTEIALAQAHQRELDIGTRIQQALLASSPAHHVSELWVSSFSQASRGIDGDFVDVIQVSEHCLDIIAGDVMGKGVPAALMGAATKLQISRSIAELLSRADRRCGLPEPAAIVSSVHQAMTPHLQALDAFVTLSYIRIDTERHILTWVGCGHEESLLIRQDGTAHLLANQHPPLGVLDNSQYSQNETPLRFGEAVFLCSDGLADAICVNGDRIGREKINATVRHLVSENTTPAAVLHLLRKRLLHQDTQVNDDVTMVLVMRAAQVSEQSRCELPVAMSSLRSFRQFVAAQAAHAGLSEQDSALLEIAGVELFTNIVRHGQGLLAGAPVELVGRLLSQELVMEIIYLGDAFSPPEEIVEADLNAYPEGGFGLTIIRNACDHVEYLHHAGVNTVRFSRLLAT